jgi:hypothetical protein
MRRRNRHREWSGIILFAPRAAEECQGSTSLDWTCRSRVSASEQKPRLAGSGVAAFPWSIHVGDSKQVLPNLFMRIDQPSIFRGLIVSRTAFHS